MWYLKGRVGSAQSKVRDAVTAVSVLAGGSAALAGPANLPPLAKDTPYSEAEKSLTALGWQPVHITSAQKFLWRRGATLIEIRVHYEGLDESKAILDRVRCRSGCAKD